MEKSVIIIEKEKRMHKILLVEDDQVIRQQVGKMLWMGIWSGSGRRLYGSFESFCPVGASSGPSWILAALV